MPVTRRRYLPKRTKRYSYRRRRYGYRKPPMPMRRPRYNRMNIMKCPSAIPNKMRVKLSFAYSVQTAFTAGGGNIPFRIVAGALPFGLGFGTPNINPQFFDQWAGMYFQYRPLGCSINAHVGVITDAASGVESLLTRSYWSSSGTPFLSDQAILNNRFTTTRYMNPQEGFKTINTYSKLHTACGLSRRQWYDEADTAGSTNPNPGTNPARQVSYYIHLVAPTSSIAMTVTLEVRGFLYVEFFNPVNAIDA